MQKNEATLLEQAEQLVQKESFVEAEPILAQAVSINPASATAQYSYGCVLQRLGKIRQAIKAYKEALKHDPDNYDTYKRLVVTYSDNGNYDHAESLCRRMLDMVPDNPEPYKYIAQIKKYAEADIDEIHGLERSLAKLDPESDVTIDLYFALGKIFNDIGEYDKAFDYYRKANSTFRKKNPYNEQENLENFKALHIKTFTKEFFEERKDFGHPSDLPVFIVGMPRSGTSLVDQILASHPDIHCAGELIELTNVANTMAQQLNSSLKYPQCLITVGKDSLYDLSEQYLSLLTAKTTKNPKRAVDKMPHNFWHLGLIALLFPNARIINCTRNPLGNGLSLYFARFARGNYYSYGMETIGFYINLHKTLMQHWSEALPMPIFDITYENVVTDTENQIRSLLDFCGLPWDDACLEHYKTKRAVSTASNWQVKQPIYKGSVDLWKNYEQHLEPLKNTLNGAP